MKTRIIIFSIFAVWAIIIVCTYTYYRDYKAYRLVLEELDEHKCNWYLELFPNGSYVDSVLSLKDVIVYKAFQEKPDMTSAYHYVESCPNGKHTEDVWYKMISFADNKLVSINDYLQRYPKGKYANVVNEMCDSLWDNEIEKYNQRDKRKESPKAVKYITEMLQYMKIHRITTVRLQINSDTRLKDFSEYTRRERILACGSESELSNVESKMVSIKDNFTSYDEKYLAQILIDGIKNNFSSFFSTDFVDVVYDDTKSYNKKFPLIVMSYTIKSQEDYGGYPHIWEYSSSYSKYGMYITQNYLVGISISFNASFTIPGRQTKYEYCEKGNPLKAQFDVSSISDGYRKMTQYCFENFSQKLSENIGVKQTSK